MKRPLFICLLFLIPFLSPAQKAEPSQQTKVSESKQKKIKLLMETTGSAKLSLQMMSSLVQSMKIRYPNVDNAFWEEFLKESKTEDLMGLMLPVYDKYLTEPDIDALLVFYNSPVGKKFISSMPFILKESMEIGESWGRQVGEKVMNKLKAKGYIKEQ